jgi:hypothetical protein
MFLRFDELKSKKGIPFSRATSGGWRNREGFLALFLLATTQTRTMRRRSMSGSPPVRCADSGHRSIGG